MKAIVEIICEDATCKKAFITTPSNRARGFGRFCSRRCAAKNRPRKPPMEKNCLYCGNLMIQRADKITGHMEQYFEKRKYCGKECRIAHIYSSPSKNANSSRNRARVLYGGKPCEVCGNVKADVHHKDSNPINNSPDNIMVLCRKCHMVEHAKEGGKKRLDSKICRICGIKFQPRRAITATCGKDSCKRKICSNVVRNNLHPDTQGAQ